MYNPATNAQAGRACLTGFAFVILSASLAQADYGPRTSIGDNYQQTSFTVSPNGSIEGSCNGTAFCYVLFQVPLGQKPLIVQHVSCRLLVSAGGLLSTFLFTRTANTFPIKRTYLMPVNTTGNWWVVSNPVMHLVESGERPVVFFNNSAGPVWDFVECTISGTLQQ